jgi:predicted RNA binding protein YcfA (HicA-like mRNA interferase family)
MPKREKLRDKLRSNPRGIRFSELETVLRDAGFLLDRVTGSHYIYQHPDGRQVNLVWRAAGNVKTYQVRQVLEVLDG